MQSKVEQVNDSTEVDSTKIAIAAGVQSVTRQSKIDAFFVENPEWK